MDAASVQSLVLLMNSAFRPLLTNSNNTRQAQQTQTHTTPTTQIPSTMTDIIARSGVQTSTAPVHTDFTVPPETSNAPLYADYTVPPENTYAVQYDSPVPTTAEQQQQQTMNQNQQQMMDSSKRTDNKKRRRVAVGTTVGVVTGAVLLGPIGAVAGGVVGVTVARRKNKKTDERATQRSVTAGALSSPTANQESAVYC